MELMEPPDMVNKNLRPGKMVYSGFVHLQDCQDFLAQRTAKTEEMHGPVRGQGLIDMGNLGIDQKPLAFGDDGSLVIYDKFTPAIDAVEPLVKGHPARAADGFLPVVYSDQLQLQRERGMVGGVVDLEYHIGRLSLKLLYKYYNIKIEKACQEEI